MQIDVMGSEVRAGQDDGSELGEAKSIRDGSSGIRAILLD